ncbi:MAG: hypothetical protein WCS43_13840 [Verrucomicrobiota bacterium]
MTRNDSVFGPAERFNRGRGDYRTDPACKAISWEKSKFPGKCGLRLLEREKKPGFGLLDEAIEPLNYLQKPRLRESSPHRSH